MAMLMEGGVEDIATGNSFSHAVDAVVLSGNERAYNRTSSLSDTITNTSATNFLQSNNNIVLTNDRDVRTMFSGQSKAITECSTSARHSTSAEANKSDTGTIITELDYPAIGSPPADLMVVNTNGFNPLQHAALRGNPG